MNKSSVVVFAFLGIIALTALGFIYFQLAPIFRPFKLRSAGYQFIESDSSFFSNKREFFRNGFISPNNKFLAVASQFSEQAFSSGDVKVSVFDLDKLKKLWTVDIEKSDGGEYMKAIWNDDSTQFLLYLTSTYSRIIDAKSGKEIRKFDSNSPCIFELRKSTVHTQFRYSFCSKKNLATLISTSDFSILFNGSYSNTLENTQKYQLAENSDYMELISPNQNFNIKLKDKSILISLKQSKKSWTIPTHWQIDTIIWSKDSEILAIGGDDYPFERFNGEIISSFKNMLLLRWNGQDFTKQRLDTYGEAPAAIAFLDNPKRLIGLTDTTILIWKL